MFIRLTLQALPPAKPTPILIGLMHIVSIQRLELHEATLLDLGGGVTITVEEDLDTIESMLAEASLS